MKTLSVNTIETPGGATAIDRPTAAPGEGFGEVLEAAVKKVDDLQLAADAEAQKLANGDGNLHETMLALEKADVAMRVAMKVRTKLVDAYNDVMRMTV
ncbi:MAG: flagellar hook-basal body complex protein FliE [Myxococcaceae bacterium]|jgi:flagellar hook-basal body complex protein FliE|nr:flagellar hook-basal body complex protein FliE [Myxococcaceae bacterium]MCA3015489.1 flagellar hook-basal body complex protein FliE [Myxococcaceae bacterium]